MTESEPDPNRDPSVPPPASTEWSHDASDEGGDLPLPPFFAGAEESAPMTGREPVMETAETEEPADTGMAVEGAEEEAPFPFEDMGAAPVEAPGVMETTPEEEAVEAQAAMPGPDEEGLLPTEGVPEAEEAPLDFPVEAFHLPERNLVDEVEPTPVALDHTAMRALELADRLDRLAGALRSRGTGALTDQLAGGDRFDALLTGLLAGFLAAGDE